MTLVLLVLAKAPQPGKVKTRLCPPADSVGAARVAAAALLDTLDIVSTVNDAKVVVALAGDLRGAEAAHQISTALRCGQVIEQRGDSLGDRIASAHADVARLHPGDPVIQVGMDTPQISTALLSHCRDELGSPGVDAAVAPALDGGWWALGLKDPLHAKLIDHVPTSRRDTGEQTFAALQDSGLTVATLPPLSDVDTAQDALRVAAEIPDSRFARAAWENL
jgi:hypothetical protein